MSEILSHDRQLPQPNAPRNLLTLSRPFFGLILVSTIILTVAGIYCMLHMPSGIYPEVSFPRIVIVVQTPGLAVKDVEIAVTRPIEDAVNIVLGVNRVRSKSIRGAAEVEVDFVPGTDMVQATNDVRARMADVEPQFPPGSEILVERQTPSIFPVISFVVTGDRDPAALYDYAFYDLRPRVSRIDDVSYVTVFGGDIREILVEVEPERLVAAGLSIADVADRLGKEHRMKAVGRLDRGTLQYQVLTNTQSVDLEDLENRVIAEKNGQAVRIRDLGRVAIAHADRTASISSDGKDSVAVTVFRRLKGNALNVSRDLDAMLEEASKTAPPGIKIIPVYDQSLLVRTAIDNVRDAILIGGAMSVLILLMFLKSARATLLTSLSIPLSLMISFLFLRLSGDSLNLMSLGGLAVAIGLIIDDSVVVVENIARHLAEGQTGDAAIARASREISGAVIGSTLTTILVFVPLAFVRGVIGQFFQSLSIALSIALLVSMVVSLTLVPVLAARYLGRRRMPSTGPIYGRLENGYERLLRIGLRYPRWTLALALLAVLPGWWLFNHVETGFMPKLDEGAFVLDYWMPVGTSLAETDKVLKRVDAILHQIPDIAGCLRRTGAENGVFATEAFRGDILISLKPPGQRRDMETLFDVLREQLAKEVPELATVEFVPLVQDEINDLSGVKSPIEVKIFGPDPAVLRDLASRVGKILEQWEAEKKVADVNTNVLLGNPDIVVRPDSLQTARVGLSAQDVETQLSAALYGQVAATLPKQDRLMNIRVRYPDYVRFDLDRLARLPISLPSSPSASDASSTATSASASGNNHVLLAQVASIRRERSPNELWRENQQPVITVAAELGDWDLGRANRELMKELPKIKFPTGYRWELVGNYRSQQETFASLFLVLIVAAAIVFLLLGFQFRSLTLPLLIFLTQPVSLASAMFALWITGTPLNVSSFMGAILLIGLDVKNGIILIEYIGQLRKEGQTLNDALIHAGRRRFRPILMTSLCTIFGLAPLAMGFGPGAQMQQPLAIAVMGGLIANMLLTRLLIPVGYLVLKQSSPIVPPSVSR
jgi:CzcA family heavy metal efflux pump